MPVPKAIPRPSTTPLKQKCVRNFRATKKTLTRGSCIKSSPVQSTQYRQDVQPHHIKHLSSSTISTPQVLLNDMANQEVIIAFSPEQALRYPSFWLRDHCLCPECSHAHTHQRQSDTFALDPALKASTAESTPSGLEVTWADSVAHTTSVFPWEWLEAHSPFPTPTTVSRHTRSRQWKPLQNKPPHPSVSYDEIMSSSDGIRKWISQIHTYGLSFVPGTPRTPEATQSLIERIAFIRPTHYGGFWDFTSVPAPIDTAYTPSPLPLHTDTTYFTDPAGLQLFHCLQPASTGGESTFADAFAAASALYASNPKAYHALSSIPVVSSAEGAPEGTFSNTTTRSSGWPVFVHHGGDSSGGGNFKPQNLVQVRWNNLDRSPRTTWPSHQVMKTWYAAARVWSQVLEKGGEVCDGYEGEMEVLLEPGTPVMFDNWRVVHGRRGFVDRAGKGVGRRVCGGYVGMDDFRARGRSLGLDM